MGKVKSCRLRKADSLCDMPPSSPSPDEAPGGSYERTLCALPNRKEGSEPTTPLARYLTEVEGSDSEGEGRVVFAIDGGCVFNEYAREDWVGMYGGLRGFFC